MLSSEPRFVFILGMHRSGTSCLAGALHATGLTLGPVNKKHPDNKLGNRENTLVRKINDRILADNNGSWKEPPDFVEVRAEHRKHIQEFLSNFGSKQLIGIKDPRMVLISEPWLTSAKSFQLIATYRHPMAVADSLQKRDAIPIEQGLKLWMHYNQRLLELHRNYNFPVVEYDLNQYEDYCRNISEVAGNMGLPKNDESIQQFVSSELQHSGSNSEDIPSACREIHSNLVRIRFTS